MTPSRTLLTEFPNAFETLVGTTVEDFAVLVVEIRPAHDAARRDRLARPGRRRAPGAGRRPALGLADYAAATVLLSRFGGREAVADIFGVGIDTLARAYRRLLPILVASSAAHLLAPLPLHERRERLLRALDVLPNGDGLFLMAWRCGLVCDDGIVRDRADCAVVGAADEPLW
jgi:hypothetical protein